MEAKSDKKRSEAVEHVKSKLSETLVHMEQASKTASKVYAKDEDTVYMNISKYIQMFGST